MREEDFLQDVTLVGDDNSQIAAHKLVLSACSEILNLPIWANFVDPTDLSLYYLPTLDQPTLFYSLNLNLNQLNKLRTRLDKQSRLSLAY